MSDSATAVHQEEAHEHHSSSLQHHFTTYEQQMEAGKIGMWLFLATEILLFGGLFVGFGLMQAKYPEAFVEAHHHLDKKSRLFEHRGSFDQQFYHGHGRALRQD